MRDRRMDLVTLRSAQLSCSIALLGAELQRLSGADGREYLWNGDPAVWSGRAPILFPIVGMLARGEYRWRGRSYALEKHGFARRRKFAIVEQEAASVTLRLTADDATRRAYPFDYQLDLRFALAEALAVTATVRNRGDGAMPFSFGFHPALSWPRDGDARIMFDAREQGPVWRMDRDGLIARHEPLPGDGLTLALDDGLFADDAMILRDVASRGVRFDSGDTSVRVTWDNLPDLGLWTKPGAPYLCIEPWAGFNDLAGFDGDLSEKPGIMMLAPGSSWTASMTIAPL
ncbi:MAG: aldose 1-epimerase family protein [Sphingomonas bacterium]|nr:aldose 1-epimerase family protein [Sphingomonas bacterium]